METQKTTWENIVFEFRNKEYGAFKLRNEYSRNISISILIVTTSFVLLFIIPTLFRKKESASPTIENQATKIVYYAELAPPPPIERTYIPPKTVEQHTVQKVVKYVAPKVTTMDVKEVEDIPTMDEVKNNVIGTQNIEGTGNIVYDEPIQVEAIAEPIAEPPAKPKKEETVVYSFVQKQPEFPGGPGALIKFLNDNIIYPHISQENGVQGTVIVQFTVNDKGNLIDLNVVRGIDRSCDEEALRVVKTMPKWAAGEQNGKKVSVRYTLPIRFILN